MSTIDWNKVKEDAKSIEDGEYPVAPKGRYTVEFAKATAKLSSTGKEMIQARVIVVTDGPHKGVSFLDHFVVNPENSQALAFLFQNLNIIGVGDILTNGGSLEQVAAAMTGRRVEADLIVEKYKGKDGNKRDRYYPLGTAAPTTTAASAF